MMPGDIWISRAILDLRRVVSMQHDDAQWSLIQQPTPLAVQSATQKLAAKRRCPELLFVTERGGQIS